MTAANARPAAVTVVPPGRALRGRVVPPGSKSITNRALLLAALAQGTSRLTGALKSDDTALHGGGAPQHGRRRCGTGLPTGFTVTATGRLAAPSAPRSAWGMPGPQPVSSPPPPPPSRARW